MPKTIEEITNKGLVKIEELRKLGVECVNQLEKEAEENPQLFMKNACISGWLMNFFSINKEGKLV
ncbi:MAG TPA: hypothetical protein VMZ91_09500 [Candidatus Paceibacterota bacterium]|nr:hypothetical protein [Candidatus Paceibacterota bacterium]